MAKKIYDPSAPAPPGFSVEPMEHIQKAEPAEAAAVVDADAVVDDKKAAQAARAAQAVAPAAVDHGKKAGAGNAFAFHNWQPPKK